MKYVYNLKSTASGVIRRDKNRIVKTLTMTSGEASARNKRLKVSRWVGKPKNVLLRNIRLIFL